MRRFLDLFYTPAWRALELGYTHHASLYGIPSWAMPDEFDPVALRGEAKVGLLTVVVIFCDLTLYLWDLLTGMEGELREAPIYLLDPITAEPGQVAP